MTDASAGPGGGSHQPRLGGTGRSTGGLAARGDGEGRPVNLPETRYVFKDTHRFSFLENKALFDVYVVVHFL